MAVHVSDDLVRQRLAAISRKSATIKKMLNDAVVAVRRKPDTFPTMEFVPPPFDRPGTFVRKIKVRHGRHSYRVLYLHQVLPNGDERVDYWCVRERRTEGYDDLDWNVIAERLEPDEE